MSSKLPKIFSVLFILFIILQTFSFIFLNQFYFPALAKAEWEIPDLQITSPGMKKFTKPGPCPDDPSKTCVPWIGEYIAGIYKYAIGIVGILATVVMMIGGVMWIVAGGNVSRVSEAKAWIGASLTGLVLALSSYVILYQINPKLTQFEPIKVARVEKTPVGIDATTYEELAAIAAGVEQALAEARAEAEALGKAAIAAGTARELAAIAAGVEQALAEARAEAGELGKNAMKMATAQDIAAKSNAVGKVIVEAIAETPEEETFEMSPETMAGEIEDWIFEVEEALEIARELKEETEQAAEENLLCIFVLKVQSPGASNPNSHTLRTEVNSENECRTSYNEYIEVIKNDGFTVFPESHASIMRIRATVN